MTQAKICGFTTVEPLLAAADAGADALALVFVPGLKRTLTPDQGQELVDALRTHAGSNTPAVVGIFGDQPTEEVNTLSERLDLDWVQLTGGEGMAYCAQMTRPVYKAIGIDPDLPKSAVMVPAMVMAQRHTMAGHRIIIDARPKGAYGGTGQTYDWSIAADLSMAFDLSLAGGLTPDNVADAIAEVRPWGVDTSSGVETDGQKDLDKIRAFVQAVREADRKPRRGGLFRIFGRSA